MTAPDGSVTSYQYAGATTKVTDPAGKWKQFANDAMGNLVTSYAYNFANQLRKVTMPRTEGTQTRTFQWSGSDLVSATNPENGTVTYQYRRRAPCDAANGRQGSADRLHL